MSDPFWGPELKIKRAYQHILDFKAIVDQAIADNSGGGFVSSPTGGVIAVRFPEHTPTILGDAIHNLRAALDHLYCILIQVNGGTPGDYSRFPFMKSKEDLKATLKGQKKIGLAPSDKVCGIIVDDVQPFPGGQTRLYDLHRLDITDKHMTLLPVTGLMKLPNATFFDKAGKVTHRLSGGPSFVMRYDQSGKGLMRLPDAHSVRYDNDEKCTFQIRFAESQPLAGEDILTALTQLHKIVGSVTHLLTKAAT